MKHDFIRNWCRRVVLSVAWFAPILSPVTPLEAQNLVITELMMELGPDEPLKATLRIGSQTLSVFLPQRVARVGSKVALPAAHEKVLKWRVEERIAFATDYDAFNSDFEPTDD